MLNNLEELIGSPPAFIASDLIEVRGLLFSLIPDDERTLLRDITLRMNKTVGKGIRPILSIACSRALFGKYKFESILLAAAVELIHIATLLHDDVIDNADERRGEKTIHKIWDNKSSILLGDYIFSNAFKFMVKTGNIRVLDLLANTSEKLSIAEIEQIDYNKTGVMDENSYMKVIKGKTASLFSAVCEAPSLLIDNPNISKSLSLYGECFGIIYQLTDDMLDYTGNNTGKQRYTDFIEGKLTLPLIKLISLLNEHDKATVLRNFGSKINDEFAEWLDDIFAQYKIKKLLSDYARVYIDTALNAIASLDDSIYKSFLIDIITVLYNRDT